MNYRLNRPLSGRNDSSQLSLEPFFLLDDCISYYFGPALAAVGFRVTTVRQEWPDRDPMTHPVLDASEIIPYLGAVGEHRAVWVTSDWDAQKAHARMITAERISVLWLNEPKGKSLTGLRELQLLSLIMPDVHPIIARATTPTYLRAYLSGRRPKLDQLAGTLFDAKLNWRKVSLFRLQP